MLCYYCKKQMHYFTEISAREEMSVKHNTIKYHLKKTFVFIKVIMLWGMLEISVKSKIATKAIDSCRVLTQTCKQEYAPAGKVLSMFKLLDGCTFRTKLLAFSPLPPLSFTFKALH